MGNDPWHDYGVCARCPFPILISLIPPSSFLNHHINTNKPCLSRLSTTTSKPTISNDHYDRPNDRSNKQSQYRQLQDNLFSTALFSSHHQQPSTFQRQHLSQCLLQASRHALAHRQPDLSLQSPRNEHLSKRPASGLAVSLGYGPVSRTQLRSYFVAAVTATMLHIFSAPVSATSEYLRRIYESLPACDA